MAGCKTGAPGKFSVAQAGCKRGSRRTCLEDEVLEELFVRVLVGAELRQPLLGLGEEGVDGLVAGLEHLEARLVQAVRVGNSLLHFNLLEPALVGGIDLDLLLLDQVGLLNAVLLVGAGENLAGLVLRLLLDEVDHLQHLRPHLGPAHALAKWQSVGLARYSQQGRATGSKARARTPCTAATSVALLRPFLDDHAGSPPRNNLSRRAGLTVKSARPTPRRPVTNDPLPSHQLLVPSLQHAAQPVWPLAATGAALQPCGPVPVRSMHHATTPAPQTAAKWRRR